MMKQAIHMTHNRLVAGSNPAGATKFKLCHQQIKATVKGGFFVGEVRVAVKWRCNFLMCEKYFSDFVILSCSIILS